MLNQEAFAFIFTAFGLAVGHKMTHLTLIGTEGFHARMEEEFNPGRAHAALRLVVRFLGGETVERPDARQELRFLFSIGKTLGRLTRDTHAKHGAEWTLPEFAEGIFQTYLAVYLETGDAKGSIALLKSSADLVVALKEIFAELESLDRIEPSDDEPPRPIRDDASERPGLRGEALRDHIRNLDLRTFGNRT